MKKNTLFSLFILLIVNSFSSNGQQWVEMMKDPNVNFYETQAAFNAYWQNRPYERGKGYKQFKRWEHKMAPRVYPSGDVKLASNTYKNYKQWEDERAAAGIPKSTNGTWTIVGPTGKPTGGGAGRVNFVRFDPINSNIMWAGTPDGGLWKTINGGTSWSTNTDQLTVIGCSDVAIDPTNTSIMYLATGDNDGSDTYSIGVLKSIDGGATWNTTGLNWTASQGRTIGRLLIHPTNPQIVMAFSSAGIYRTTNGGTTWTQPTGTFSCSDAEFKPGDPTTVYACGTSFKRSTDGGVTWTTVTTGLTGIGRLAMAVTEANPAYVYLLAARASDNGFLGLVRSTNSGAAFTTRMASTASNNILGWDSGADSGGQGWYDLAIAASPTNAETVFTGGINIWKSTNGGTNFTKTSVWTASNSTYVHADIHDLIFQPGNGTTVFAGCDGGVFKSTNTGTAWSDLSSNLQIAQQYRISISTSNANLVLAGHQDNGTNLSTNGTSWAQKVGGDGMDCYVDRTTNSNMIASLYYGDYYRSTNGGTSFSNIVDPTADGSEDWVSVIHQDPTTSAIAYAGGRPKLYKCNNIWGTVSWTALGTPSGSGNITEFAIAPSNNQIIYTLKSGTNAVAKSTNGGTSFTSVSTGLPTSVFPTWIAISNTDPNVAFVTYSGYGATNKVYKTINGGTTWTNLSTGLPNVPVNCIVYQNGNTAGDGIYIGTDVGVYYRDNSMTTWVDFSAGLPNCSVTDLEIYYATGRLKAGTFGRGTWESDLYSNVPTLPVASFTANNQSICLGQAVQFTNTSTGSPTSYSWTFAGGNPATSTAANPVVTYASAGTYAVSLTVTNANGTDTENQTTYITVSAGGGVALPFVEGFTTTTFPPTTNWTIINTDGGSTSWARNATIGIAPTAGNSLVFDNFNFDDRPNQDVIELPKLDFSSFTSSSMTFNVAYAAYGASNADGLQVLVSTDCGTTFTIEYDKSGSTVAAGNLPTAAAQTTQFTPTTAQWRTETIDLNAYTGQNGIIIQFKNIAAYGNRLFIDNINITGTGTPVVPTASFTSTPTAATCTGQTVQYTSTSTGTPTTYAWTFPGGTPATSSLQNPTVTYATAGTYNASLTVTNSAGSTTSDQSNYITVNDTPNAPTTTPADRCGNGTVTLGATASAGTLSWFATATGGTALGTGATFTTPSISTTTTYYVSSTASGCTSARTPVVATINPTPTVTSPGNKTACLGIAVAAISFSGSSSSSTYAWTNSNTSLGLSASGNGNIASFTPTTTGTTTVTVTPTLNSCQGNPVTFTITVNPLPTVVLANLNTVCDTDGSFALSGGTPTGGTYSGTGVTNNNFNPSTAGAGTYTITYTATQNGCSNSATNTIQVDACASIEDLLATLIIIYPNPTSGLLTVKDIPLDKVSELELIDAAGRKVGNWKLDNAIFNLDLSAYASGSYNLIFKGEELQLLKRLEIKK